MCFCCCTTRKSILIYAIVISSFAFIYGIVAISKFGSKTEIYKVLIDKLKELESKKDSSTSDYNSRYNGYKTKNNRRIDNYDDYNYNSNYYYNQKVAKAILDTASYSIIQGLTPNDIKQRDYSFIKSLKGIENGLGVILFIFPTIFLVIEIIFLIFTCGIKEYKVLPNNTFIIFNILKIVCITLSTLFIFLSLLYAILLIVVLAQYINLLSIIDSCSIGIIVGMVYGYYGIWYYIILSCAFCHERTKFLNVGSEGKPGPEAMYDINGNPILKPSQPIIIAQAIQPQIPQVVEVKPNPINYNQNYSNSNGIGDEYIVVNGITYKRVDNVNANINNNNININNKIDNNINDNNKNNNNDNNSNNNYQRNNARRNSKKKNSNKRRNSKSNKINVEQINESVHSKTEMNH